MPAAYCALRERLAKPLPMGHPNRPVQPWETLQLIGIVVRIDGVGLAVEMTVDGAAALAHNLLRLRLGKPHDAELVKMFLDELVNKGKGARSRSGTKGRANFAAGP